MWYKAEKMGHPIRINPSAVIAGIYRLWNSFVSLLKILICNELHHGKCLGVGLKKCWTDTAEDSLMTFDMNNKEWEQINTIGHGLNLSLLPAIR